MLDLTLGLAFLAGLTSFFAPCVTVLVPAFLSHMAGVSLTDVNDTSTQKKIFLNTLLFIVGFTVVFVLLGASLGFSSQFIRDFQIWISRVGGVVIIYLGLASLKLVPSPFSRLQSGLPGYLFILKQNYINKKEVTRSVIPYLIRDP